MTQYFNHHQHHHNFNDDFHNFDDDHHNFNDDHQNFDDDHHHEATAAVSNESGYNRRAPLTSKK